MPSAIVWHASHLGGVAIFQDFYAKEIRVQHLTLLPCACQMFL